MSTESNAPNFAKINNGFRNVFNNGRMSIGLVVPIESYPYGPVPTMQDHIERVKLAEGLGFKAVWIRDVLFNVPTFGDAGQVYDPFVYLGMLAGLTKAITLGVASLVLPQRHAAQVAKAAASIDVLSGGRLVLGVASGDRPEEYPAINLGFDDRGERFRESVEYIKRMMQGYGQINNSFGHVNGALDLLPKPHGERFPMMITGGSQQSPNWGAEHLDGLITYPRSPKIQAHVVDSYRSRVNTFTKRSKPVMQPLYIDIDANDNSPVSPIHLGVRCGINRLLDYLLVLRDSGVNHVALNLRFNRTPVEETLQKLSEMVLPHFHSDEFSHQAILQKEGMNG